MNNIVAIIFRFVNFGVLVGIFVYLFKTKLSKVLELRVAQNESTIDNLRSKQMLLENQETNIEHAKQEQAEEYVQLKQKLEQWNFHVADAMQKKQKEVAVIQEKAVGRAQKQAAYFTNQKLRQQAINYALIQAEHDLKKKFENEKEAAQYLQTILRFMKGDHEA